LCGEPLRNFDNILRSADPESQERTDTRTVPIDSAFRPSIGMKFLGLQCELLGNMQNNLLGDILFALRKSPILLKVFEESTEADLVGVGIPTIDKDLLRIRQHP